MASRRGSTESEGRAVIVTDRFVFLAFPRTGTTFVRQALRELYLRSDAGLLARIGWRRRPTARRFRELILPIQDTWSAERAGRRSQHGTVSQIPPEARALPVMSLVRHPLDQIVSAYEFRYWQKNPIWEVGTLEREYPGYPDLTFEQYVDMTHVYGVRNLAKGESLRADVGPVTLRFLKFYSRNPGSVVHGLTDADLDGGKLIEDLSRVRFVHTENLVPELREFLAEVGFPPAQTEFIAGLPRANAAETRRGRPWSTYYTTELLEKVRYKERALFRLFPRYGF